MPVTIDALWISGLNLTLVLSGDNRIIRRSSNLLSTLIDLLLKRLDWEFDGERRVGADSFQTLINDVSTLSEIKQPPQKKGLGHGVSLYLRYPLRYPSHRKFAVGPPPPCKITQPYILSAFWAPPSPLLLLTSYVKVPLIGHVFIWSCRSKKYNERQS